MDQALAHFYHVYSDGGWLLPAEEHAKALADSGLREALAGFYLGVVGADTESPVELFRDYGLDPHVRAHAETGWEHVTLAALRNHAVVYPGYLFYAHTKSAHDASAINVGWRKDMCFQNVIRWRECVAHLDSGTDIVGAHYIDDGHRFFGGNYWWASSRYVRSLPPLTYHSRWCAEYWIGEARHQHFDMNPGWPDPSNFVTVW